MREKLAIHWFSAAHARKGKLTLGTYTSMAGVAHVGETRQANGRHGIAKLADGHWSRAMVEDGRRLDHSI